MRIGIDVTCWSNNRGFGRYLRELLGALARVPQHDEFILFADQQTVPRVIVPPGWLLRVAGTREAPTRAAAADSRRSLGDMWTLRRLVASEPLDLMFFPAVYSYFPVAGRVPCLVTFHDVIAETLPHLIFKSRRSRWFWNAKCRLALARATRVLTVSEASKRGLMEHFGLAADRIRVMPEAASDAFRPADRDDPAHREALARHGVTIGERFLLYVGGISPHKNIDTLLNGFARIADTAARQDVRLVIVGDYKGDSFRTCHEDLASQAARLGITQRVLFTGFVSDDDLRHLYAACQAFVFPSYLEGFGLPAVEAMACGAAVVASDRGSLPEVLDGAGAMFDPHDADALATALARLLDDPAWRDELRSRSLRRAADFSWDASARRAIEVFHEFDPAARVGVAERRPAHT